MAKTSKPKKVTPKVDVQEVGLWECENCGHENIETNLHGLQSSHPASKVTCRACSVIHSVASIWMNG